MIKKIFFVVCFIFNCVSTLSTTTVTDYTNVKQLLYEQRLDLMKEDMLLKIVSLYTIDQYLIAPLQRIVQEDRQNLTESQKDLIIIISQKLHDEDFLIATINNMHCISYAFYKGNIPGDKNIEVTPEESVYGALLATGFEIIFAQCATPEAAHDWIARIITSNPYRDYDLDMNDVEEFYYTAPIQTAIKRSWQNMWSRFKKGTISNLTMR